MQADRMTLTMLRRAYTDPQQRVPYTLPSQQEGWWEYGNYTGDFAVAAFGASLVGIMLSTRGPDRSRAMVFAVAAIALLALSAGEFSQLSPASLVKRLPLLSYFRLPSRYTIPVVLFGAMTIAAALRDSVRLLTLPWRIGAAAMFLLAAAQIVSHNSFVLRGVFTQPPLDRSFRPLAGATALAIEGHGNAYIGGSPMLRALMQDTNFYNCYEPLQFIRTAQRELPLVSVSDAAVTSTSFSPNRVDATVRTGSSRGRVFMNQNFAPGWTSNVGPVVLDGERGQMSATVPPGFHGTVTFRYWPPGLTAGLAIFMVACAACRVAWRWQLPTNRRFSRPSP
jgi:hypothetical protein